MVIVMRLLFMMDAVVMTGLFNDIVLMSIDVLLDEFFVMRSILVTVFINRLFNDMVTFLNNVVMVIVVTVIVRVDVMVSW
jgi:hypothetical protein